VADFNTWLGTLPHPTKIVVAGNHELSFDPSTRGVKKGEEELENADLLASPRTSHAAGSSFPGSK